MEEPRRRTFVRAHSDPASQTKALGELNQSPPSPAAAKDAITSNLFFYSQRSGSKPLLYQRPPRRVGATPKLAPTAGQPAAAAAAAHTVSSARSSAATTTAFRPVSSRARQRTISPTYAPLATAPRTVTSPTQTDADDLQERLHEVKHLFLCCRDLLSISHIQHLSAMVNLECLNLHMNLIKHVEGLSSLRRLVELDVSANEIRTLEVDAFSGLHQLRRLNLSSNLLRELPKGALQPLQSLEWLSFGFNELVDVGGLRDIPASAPLLSVDLCGNQIATLKDVVAALAPHADTLQELRLEVPKTSALLRSQETLADPLLAVIASVQRPPHLFTRENPCCAHALIHRKPARAATGAKAPLTAELEEIVDTSGGAGGAGHYVEALMRCFPRLVVVNSVSFGLDPLLPRVHVEAASDAAVTAGGGESAGVGAWRGAPMLGAHSPGANTGFYPALWNGGEDQPWQGAGRSTAARALAFGKSARRSTSRKSTSSTSSSASSSSSSSSIGSRNRRRHRTRRARSQNRGEDKQSGEPEPPRNAGHITGKNSSAGDAGAAVDTSHSVQNITPERPDTSPAVSSGMADVEEPAPPTSLFTPPREYAASAVTVPLGEAAVHVPHGETSPVTADDTELSHASSAHSSRSNSHAEVLKPLKNNSPLSTLKWRPKRVSRGTNTEVSMISSYEQTTPGLAEPAASAEDGAGAAAASADVVMNTPVRILERELAHRCEELSDSEVRLQRAREQLSLRVAVEVDLRRQLSLVHQRCLDVEKEKEAHATRLRAQVTALKDELNRRAQESHMITRQHRAELDTLRDEAQRASTLETALAKQAAKVAALEAQLLADQNRAQSALNRAECERAEWESNAALWQTQCEALEQQHRADRATLDKAHDEAQKALRSAMQCDYSARLTLFAEETARRRGLEEEALSGLQGTLFSSCVLAWQAECDRAAERHAQHVEVLTEEQRTLTAHIAEIQSEYQDVLSHAEQELAQLRSQLASVSTLPTNHEETPRTLPTDTRTTQTEEAEISITPKTAVVSAQPPRTTTGLIHDTASYWREACRSREAEIARLEAALRISQNSYKTVSEENSRLLHQLEDEVPKKRHEEVTALQREKENLLRTVHNLQEDLGKKDENMDALEAEARTKLDEKRRRIAELEEANDTLRERQETSTQQNVRLRDDLDRAQKRVEELETKQSTNQTREEEEKTALIHALRMAREQLVAVHESHSALLQEQQSLKVLCAQKEAELADARHHFRTMQDDARARQKATLEAFSRMLLTTDVEGS